MKKMVFVLFVVLALTVSTRPLKVQGLQINEGDIMPFRDGSQAQYGIAGVYSCGHSLDGWKAVNFVLQENMVYASSTGDVSWICRDDNQVVLRIGNHLYGNLVDTGQQVGDHYTKGDQMGSLVSGSFTGSCGTTMQEEGSHYLKFCLAPGNEWSADGYILNYSTGIFTKAGYEFRILTFITADWADSSPVAPPTPAPFKMFNIWDYITGGLIYLFDLTIIPILGAFTTAANGFGAVRNYDILVYVRTAFRLIYPIVSVLNFQPVVAAVLMALQVMLVRKAIAAYMFIMDLIPWFR